MQKRSRNTTTTPIAMASMTISTCSCAPGAFRPVVPLCQKAAGCDWPAGDQALSHLVALSMDRFGTPTGLFTTNRWVTAETWYPGADVIRMLPHFAIDHAYPSWPTNRWLTAMVRLFHPQIAQLIHARDAALAARRKAHPDRDVFEDREFEVLSETTMDVAAQMKAIAQALDQ
ncbi:DUF6969 family protein [Roseinatronobacter alkalisoli]|uniref:DUF6969 domain-containing protein n=1 Tax=Roseinatronobacter alkalisoli TaxID=3028235 RepID=A0ABT5T3F5_9RHOB|nr:hypothetical protein [Roseinatronobacter sp. HJB301]MDD7969641.1 hypothetical protein [Roseinatronobacter sp. HJB301]